MFEEYSNKIRQWLKEEGSTNPTEHSDEDTKLALDIKFNNNTMTIGFLKTKMDSIAIATKLPVDEGEQKMIKHLKNKEDIVLDLKRFLYNLHISPEFTRDEQGDTITEIFLQKVIYFDGLTKDKFFEGIFDISNSVEYIRETFLRVGKP
jgi:hypothetical protein